MLGGRALVDGDFDEAAGSGDGDGLVGGDAVIAWVDGYGAAPFMVEADFERG